MRSKVAFGGAILGLLALAAVVPARAEVLITAHEARLPNDGTAARGVYIGPKIVVVSPAPNAAVKSPFHLKIVFKPRDGVAVDLSSLAVSYRKVPAVDLTNRLTEFSSPAGIDMPDAEVPPGEHRIQIEIKDVDGRLGGTDISFDVKR